jgi:hypothetical protein
MVAALNDRVDMIKRHDMTLNSMPWSNCTNRREESVLIDIQNGQLFPSINMIAFIGNDYPFTHFPGNAIRV